MTIRQGNAVYVQNEKQTDWMALVEDMSMTERQVLLHVNWVKRKPSKRHCPRALFVMDLRDKINVETVNDLIHIRDHSNTCKQSNICQIDQKMLKGGGFALMSVGSM